MKPRFKAKVLDVDYDHRYADSGDNSAEYTEEMYEMRDQTIYVVVMDDCEGWYVGNGFQWHETWLEILDNEKRPDMLIVPLPVQRYNEVKVSKDAIPVVSQQDDGSDEESDEDEEEDMDL